MYIATPTSNTPEVSAAAQSLLSTHEKIKTYRYMVGVRLVDTYTEEEIAVFGLPTVGDRRIDRVVNNEFVDRFFTIEMMHALHKKGAPFIVRDHRETKPIYEIISEYLNAWKAYLIYGINVQNAPIEDLIEYDRLAAAVYDHAVEHFTSDYIESNLAKYLGRRSIGRATYGPKPTTVDPYDPNRVKRHDSNEEFFSTKLHSWRR